MLIISQPQLSAVQSDWCRKNKQQPRVVGLKHKSPGWTLLVVSSLSTPVAAYNLRDCIGELPVITGIHSQLKGH